MTKYPVGSIGFARLERRRALGRARLVLVPYNVCGEERIALLRLARAAQKLPEELRLVFYDPSGPLREITADSVTWEGLRDPAPDEDEAAVLADAKAAKGGAR